MRRASSTLECTNGLLAGSAIGSTREQIRPWGSAFEDALRREQHAPERRSAEKVGLQEAVLGEDVIWRIHLKRVSSFAEANACLTLSYRTATLLRKQIIGFLEPPIGLRTKKVE